jgi:hypothetical protein
VRQRRRVTRPVAARSRHIGKPRRVLRALVDQARNEPDLTRLTTNSGRELVTFRALISQMHTQRRVHLLHDPLASERGTKGVVTTPGGGVTLRFVGFEEGVSLDDTRFHTGRLGQAMSAHAVDAGKHTTIHGGDICPIAPLDDVDEAIRLRRDCVPKA